MKKLQLALLWIGIAYFAYRQYAGLDIPFDSRLPSANLRLLLHRKTPRTASVYQERRLDDALAEWQLTGPIVLALPPMYRDQVFGNAGFLSSFVNHGEVILYNAPYPHPKLSIEERPGGVASPSAYHYEDRSSNAALLTREGGEVWPLGYTAWYDLLWEHRIIDVPTPYLLDGSGHPIGATAVRATHPLNRVTMYGDTTQIYMEHWSPIVWTFPMEGRLRDLDTGFAMDSVADGAEVSYLPPMAPRGERPFGMFLLSQRVAPTDSSAPAWWPLDEKFRQLVIHGGPIAERRELLRKIESAYPSHPFLAHYRVIAELGGDRFDDVWLRAQRQECQLSTWYLAAWTHVPWRTARKLPCLTELPKDRLDVRGEYIAEAAVLAFRGERDDEMLKDLAARVIDVSYLGLEFRGFNLPLSDFAWLWLRARP